MTSSETRAPTGAPAATRQTLKPITADDSILVMIDYTTRLIESVRSHPPSVLINNAMALAKTGALFALPAFVLGEENARYGTFEPTIHAPIPGAMKMRRHTVSAWREPAFVQQIEKTGRKNLIVAGISTDMCVGALALDARRAGYDVTLVVDASASQTLEMHQTGVTRLIDAGCIGTTWVALLMAELLNDLRRPEAPGAAEIVAQHIFPLSS